MLFCCRNGQRAGSDTERYFVSARLNGKQKEEVISLETLPQMLSVTMTVFSNKHGEGMNLMKQT